MHRLGEHGSHTLGTTGLHQEPGNAMLDSDPLVRLTVIRSFAHKGEEATSELTRSPVLKVQRNHQALVGGSGSGAGMLGDQISSVDMHVENAGSSQIGSILSFKQVSLELAPVDFTAHENFLTSVFNFALQLPLEHISQVPSLCILESVCCLMLFA